MPQLDPRVATAAWILECPHTGKQCKGVVLVPGRERDINTFWVEVMGNLARTMAIDLLCLQWGITVGRVAMPLDSLGIIKHIREGEGKTLQHWRHANLLQEMHQKIATLGLWYSFTHVQAHQDDIWD